MSKSDDGDFLAVDAGSEGSGFLSHLPAVLLERKWFVIVPTILGIIAALAAWLVIPSIYQSAAIMLVQSPQLPRDIAGIDDAEAVDRRIARIKQQVTSRPDLVSLIQKHGLYKSSRDSKPMSEILDDMREAITLAATEAGGGNGNERTIAFKLSFDYSEAVPAQAVAQDLMERVLELDSSTNTEQATNRVQFLSDQASTLEQQIAAIQNQIAAINGRYGGILSNSGVSMIGGNSGSYDVQIASLQRDNANLIMSRDAAKTGDGRDPAVVSAEAQLAGARAVYSESHPDVVIAKQRLAEALELAKRNRQKLPFETIDQQIAFNNSQIAALRASKAREQSQVSSTLTAQSQAPLVRQQIAELEEKLNMFNQQYQAVSTKLAAAKSGARADDQQLGERLLVVDPPVVPDTPIWPDRLILAVAGLGGGLGLGILLAIAVEFILGPIRDPAKIAAILGVQPIGVIPWIDAKHSIAAAARRPWYQFWKRRVT